MVEESQELAGTTLIVDDDPQLLWSMAEFLKLFKYRTLTANNGEKAIEIFLQHKDEINLIVLDINMPVMDGVAAYLKIREESPDVTVLMMSGEDTARWSKLGEKRPELILKPFKMLDFVNKIKEITS